MTALQKIRKIAKDEVIEQIIKNLMDQPRVFEGIDEPEDCPAEWIRLQDAIDAVEAEG